MLYIYGKSFGRYDESVIRKQIEAVTITQYMEHLIELLKEDNEEGVENFIENFIENVDSEQSGDYERSIAIVAMLDNNAFGENESHLVNLQDRLASIKNDVPFSIDLEEYAFGIAKTKDNAKLAYLTTEMVEDEENEDWS